MNNPRPASYAKQNHYQINTCINTCKCKYQYIFICYCFDPYISICIKVSLFLFFICIYITRLACVAHNMLNVVCCYRHTIYLYYICYIHICVYLTSFIGLISWVALRWLGSVLQLLCAALRFITSKIKEMPAMINITITLKMKEKQ